MSAESVRQAEIMLASGKIPTLRLFRNTVGEGWTGRLVREDHGCVVLSGASYVRFGLMPGSSDLIGWNRVEIVPAMVGQYIAQFVAPEIKKPRGVLSGAQEKWIDAVNKAGGRAGVCETPADLTRLIEIGCNK